jgi:co-chaperonin GroES (HSP10)|tara:strand:+ start:718 stop:975 length:258 start_codon:yes stop_codon:yes gene_type:complete
MKAINNWLVIEKIKDKPIEVGGLVITEMNDSETRYARAKVISAGNLVEGVSDGDIVQYDKHSGFGISVKNTLYYVISIRDVVIIE